MKTLIAHDDGTSELLDEDGTPLPGESALDAAKREKRWDIRLASLHAEFAGFQYGGNTYASDDLAQRRLAAMILRSIEGSPAIFPITWPLASGGSVSLTKQDVRNLAAALGDHVIAIHTTMRTLLAQIAAATTLAQVQAVVWP